MCRSVQKVKERDLLGHSKPLLSAINYVCGLTRAKECYGHRGLKKVQSDTWFILKNAAETSQPQNSWMEPLAVYSVTVKQQFIGICRSNPSGMEHVHSEVSSSERPC